MNSLFKKIALGGILLSGLFLASCTSTQNTVDIINPDAEYRYFFGATCPHCQELNAIAKETDLYNRISIEKREIYRNNENREIFLEFVESIGLDPSEVGVPFVYDTVTGEYAVGVKPAFTLMTERIRNPIPNNSTTDSESTLSGSIEETATSEDQNMQGTEESNQEVEDLSPETQSTTN